MKTLQIVGVTELSDSYPNIKYKIIALDKVQEFNTKNHIHNIRLRKPNRSAFEKVSLAFNIIYGHFCTILKSSHPKLINFYVMYPGLALVFILRIIKNKNAIIFLDAFISMYDTIVNDRKLLKASNPLAKLLYLFEKTAYRHSTKVIVDTKENAKYYSKLFKLEENKFIPIPLSIPKFSPPPDTTKIDKNFNCLFIGTFVPLQGVETIAETALLMTDFPQIKFTLIGDGQTSERVEKIFNKRNYSNVNWIRKILSTEKIETELNNTDICLGIFGHTEKAQRVIPYKIYYYLSKGITTITSETSAIKELLSSTEEKPINLITCKPKASDIRQKIIEIMEHKIKPTRKHIASRNFAIVYGEDAIIKRLSYLSSLMK